MNNYYPIINDADSSGVDSAIVISTYSTVEYGGRSISSYSGLIAASNSATYLSKSNTQIMVNRFLVEKRCLKKSWLLLLE